jgi:uncharacterized protein
MNGLAIEFGGAEITLLAERAIWWTQHSTLLVADVHVGKGATFRAMGVPVPSGSSEKDLTRIGELIAATKANRVVILGDLLHARIKTHPEIVESVATWRESHRDIQIVLVRGNHDRASGTIPESWQMEVHEGEWEDQGFAFVHEPPCDHGKPTFAGHVHPKARLTDFDGSIVLAPCFVHDKHCLVLPSFGTFTGGYTVDEEEGRKIYVAAPGRVVLLPSREK